MKIVLIVAAALILATAASVFFLRSALAGGSQTPRTASEGSFWNLRTRTLEGEEIGLDRWRGRVALVVNVASKCGLTPQYEGLEALYRELSPDNDFVILGFPSNDFMGQEPGSPAEIREFCSTKYDVTFPLMHKVKVKGADKDEVYRFLTAGGLDDPSWNFTKYLVGRDGKVLARFGPKTPPDDAELRRAIERALGDDGM